MSTHIAPVELKHAYRLINHGPTVLISSHYAGVDDVMAAAWACGLDFDPPKVSVVLDKATKTRALIEQCGWFVMQVPTVRQLQLTQAVGTRSLFDEPDKLVQSGMALFRMDGCRLPFVADCAAWLACRVLPEPHNHDAYDLFIGEVIGAWSDTRAFAAGRWRFQTDPDWRSLHHIAGGNYFATGEALTAPEPLPRESS